MAPTNTPTPIPSPTPREDGAIVYQVVAGDTYIGIADKFGLTLQELYDLNDLTPASSLTVGDTLIIGYGSSSEGLTIPEFPGAVIRPDGTAVYTVKEGDTPIGIALRFGLELQELYDLNDGFDEDSVLQIGQQLVVGRQPTPQEVGGSSDMPTATASVTPTITPTNTPTIVDTPSPTVENTAVPSPINEITPTVDIIGINSGSGSSLGLMPYLLGIAAFLAVLGGIFLYLGRQS
jgi:LysM repeat protein